jgi:hypothetical protein
MKEEIKMEVDSDTESVRPTNIDPCTIDRFCDVRSLFEFAKRFQTAVGMFINHPDTKIMKLSHVFRSRPMNEDETMLSFDQANGV